eukprot:m.481887 g.481887  ORF g.481887 m.481887 type:complete len:108 (+) comp58216_c0_seq1:282-605(+)
MKMQFWKLLADAYPPAVCAHGPMAVFWQLSKTTAILERSFPDQTAPRPTADPSCAFATERELQVWRSSLPLRLGKLSVLALAAHTPSLSGIHCAAYSLCIGFVGWLQ